MEAVAYLDTHVVVWLYAGNTEAFPALTRSALAARSLRVSPMVTLELEYLWEIGRLSEGPAAVMPALHTSLGLMVCDRAFAEVTRYAWKQVWTRDPFDRLITAQAAIGGNMLITKDATITANYPHAVWA